MKSKVPARPTNIHNFQPRTPLYGHKPSFITLHFGIVKKLPLVNLNVQFLKCALSTSDSSSVEMTSIFATLRQSWTKDLALTSNLRLLPCRTSTLNRKISFTNKGMAMRFLALERGQSVQLSRFLAKIYMLGPYFAQKMGLKFGYFSSKEVV